MSAITKKYLVALTSVLALTAAGCAGGGETADQGGEVDTSATFSFSYGTPPSSLDPHLGTSDYDTMFLVPVYDRLFDLDDSGEPVPMLAADSVLDDDGSTFTITLQDGITFSDGGPVDAEAVKQNIDRILGDSRSAISAQLAAIVESVEVVDPQTVEFSLQGPGGALPTLLSSRAGMLISPEALENPDLDQAPVGSGAFVLDEGATTPGTTYVYTRRDDYWDEDAYPFQTLELQVQSNDTTRLNAVRSGQTSASFLRETQIEEAESAGLGVAEADSSLSFYQLRVNSDRKAFGEKDVRQALSLALDRDALNTAVFAGYCEPTAQPFPEGYFAHSDTFDDTDWISHDPDQARELLEGVPEEDLTFTAVVPTITAFQTLAQAMQEQLADVGITMELEVVDAVQATTRFNGGEVDAAVGSYAGSVDPSQYIASTYLESGSSNPGGLSSDVIEDLHVEAMSADDPAARGVVYDELIEEIYDLGPTAIPVCFRNSAAVYRDEVTGVAPSFAGPYQFRDVTVSR